jgi:ATP-dependent Zn protease
MKNSNRDASTAYHEAGHAVVSWCLGVRVLRASIIPDDNSTGHVKNEQEEPNTCDAIARGDRWDPSRLIAEKRVMILQAGEVAKRRYNSYSVRRGHFHDDRKKCSVLLRQYAPDEEKRDIEPHYLLLRNWTAHLIEQHWHLVEAVAKALLKHRVLSGTEFLDVISSANQEQTGINVTALMDVVEAIKRRDG